MSTDISHVLKVNDVPQKINTFTRSFALGDIFICLFFVQSLNVTLILKGIGLKILRRNMMVLYWMMLGYVIVDLDDVNVVLGGCEL